MSASRRRLDSPLIGSLEFTTFIVAIQPSGADSRGKLDVEIRPKGSAVRRARRILARCRVVRRRRRRCRPTTPRRRPRRPPRTRDDDRGGRATAIATTVEDEAEESAETTAATESTEGGGEGATRRVPQWGQRLPLRPVRGEPTGRRELAGGHRARRRGDQRGRWHPRLSDHDRVPGHAGRPRRVEAGRGRRRREGPVRHPGHRVLQLHRRQHDRGPACGDPDVRRRRGALDHQP